MEPVPSQGAEQAAQTESISSSGEMKYGDMNIFFKCVKRLDNEEKKKNFLETSLILLFTCSQSL